MVRHWRVLAGLAVASLLVACGGDDGDPQTSELGAVERALVENETRIEAALTSPPSCTSDTQCKPVYLELDRCGLSDQYRVYSTENSNEQVLQNLQGERIALASERTRLLNEVAPLPGAGCAGRARPLPPVLACRQRSCT